MENSKFKKSLVLLLSALLVLTVCFTGLSFSATSEQDVVTVLQDGSTVGYFHSDYYSVVANVKDAVENKTAVAVSVLSEKSTFISIQNKTLSEAGIQDNSSLKTLSLFVKNPTNKDLKISLKRYYNNVFEATLNNGTYYLVSKDKATVKGTTGSTVVPANFEGYIIYDLSTFTDWSTIASNDAANLVLCTDNKGLVGKTWFYSELAVSSETPEAVAKYYVSDASVDSVRVQVQNNAGTPGYCWYGTSESITLSNGKEVMKVTPSGANSGNSWSAPAKIMDNLTGLGVSSSEVNAVSFYVNNPSVNNSSANVAVKCYADSPFHNNRLNGVKAYSYDINTNAIYTFTTSTSGYVEVPSGFEGYVFYDIATARADDKLGSFFEYDFADVRFTLQNDNNSPVFFADLSVWISDLGEVITDLVDNITVWNAGEDTSNTSISDNTAWTKEIDTTVSPYGSSYHVTVAANKTPWVQVYSKGVTLDKENLSKQSALAFWLKVPENVEYPVNYVTFNTANFDTGNTYIGTRTFVNTKTGEVTSTSNISNPNTTLTDFEGFVIFDLTEAQISKVNNVADTKIGAQEFLKTYGFSRLSMRIPSSTNERNWYYDNFCFIENTDEFIAAILPKNEENYYDSILWNAGEDITDTSIKNNLTWTKEIDTTVSPYGSSYHVTVPTSQSTALVYSKGVTLDKDNLSKQSALAFWLKVPENVQFPVSFITFNSANYGAGNIHYGTRTFVNTKTGEITRTSKPNPGISLTDFEGYVILDLTEAQIGNASTKIDAQEFLKTNGFERISMLIGSSTNERDWYYDNFCFIKDTDEFILGLKEEFDIESLDGDANGDGIFDIRDLVALKKHMLDTGKSINVYGASIDGDATINDLDGTVIKMMLLDLNVEHRIKNTPALVGASIFHLKFNEWDDKYGETFADETTFVNYYTTLDPYTLSKIKEQGALSWWGLSPVGIFPDSENPTVISLEWKEKIHNTVQYLIDFNVYDVIAGFMTDEWEGKLTNEQIAAAYEYLAKTYPKMRIFSILTGSTLENTEKEVLKKTYANVTDMGYDLYASADIDRNRSISDIMNEICPSNTKIWFFPLTNKLADYATPDYMVSHIDMCYTLLKEQNNPGGLMFYNWRTWSTDCGLDNLLSQNSDYSVVYQKITEIGKEILSK